MQKRYKALRIVGTAYKTLGVLVLALSIALAFLVFLLILTRQRSSPFRGNPKLEFIILELFLAIVPSLPTLAAGSVTSLSLICFWRTSVYRSCARREYARNRALAPATSQFAVV